MSILFLYGNCQIKIIHQYFTSNAHMISKYRIIEYFYIMDPVSALEVNLSVLKDCDVFIYQHCSTKALMTPDEKYTPAYIISNILPNKCNIISIPSMYFGADFVDPITSTCNESFFVKYTFNRKLYDYLVCGESGDSGESGTVDLEDVHYDDEVIKSHIDKAIKGLSDRENKNNVTVKMTQFFAENNHTRRLMHTVNHPSKHVYHYLVNKLYEILGVPLDATIREKSDYMVKYGRQPVLPCVVRDYYNNSRYDDDQYLFSGHGKFFFDYSDFAHFIIGNRKLKDS